MVRVSLLLVLFHWFGAVAVGFLQKGIDDVKYDLCSLLVRHSYGRRRN